MTASTAEQRRFAAPHDAFGGDIPLVAVMRGPYVGSMHRGIWCVVDPQGRELRCGGDSSQPVFIRSAAKPFQVMPAILCGAVDRFGLTEREVAVLCASHHGEAYHIEAVLSVLHKAGLDESSLKCGVHPPIFPGAATKLACANAEPTSIHNNCSGAHAGMLLACRCMGWDIETYGNPDHPLQRMTRDVLAAFCGLPVHAIELAVDNCAVPAFYFSLKSAATAFARLACPDGLKPELREPARRVSRAMTSNPEMVGGSDAFDTRLMRALPHHLVCKGGAEGFHGIGLPRQQLGVAVKISDGSARAVPPTSLRLLRDLGIWDTTTHPDLVADASPEVRNARGDVVGSLVPLSGAPEE